MNLKQLADVFGETVTEEDMEENPWLSEFFEVCKHEPVPSFSGFSGFCKHCNADYVLTKDKEIEWITKKR